MSKQAETILALHEKRKHRAEAQRIFDLLPQGPSSGLNADLLDNLHAQDIITQITNKISSKFRVTGGGAKGITDHGFLQGLTDDDHPQYFPVDCSRDLTGNPTMPAGAKFYARKSDDDLVQLITYNEVANVAILGVSTVGLYLSGTAINCFDIPHNKFTIGQEKTTGSTLGSIYFNSSAYTFEYIYYSVLGTGYWAKLLSDVLSLVPATGYDNYLDIGATNLRYKDIFQAGYHYLGNTASLPSASASNRGGLIRKEGGSGVADQVCVSVKKADDSYGWFDLISGGFV